MSQINTKTTYGDSYAPTFYRDFANQPILNNVGTSASTQVGIGPNISFTRQSSVATFVNNKGYITLAPVNLIPYTNMINWSWANYSGSSIGTATYPYGVAPDGTNTSTLLTINNYTGAGASQFYTNTITTSLPIGTLFTFSCYMKTNINTNLGNTGVANVTVLSKNTVYVGNGWYRSSELLQTTASPAILGVAITFVNQPNASLEIWGPQLELGATATTYIPTYGSANGSPRFDYDPITLQCKGLLMEESRTNLLTGSNTFNAWGNAASGFISYDTNVLNPAGDYNTFYLYSTNPVNTYPQIVYKNITVLPNTDYVFSIYAKAKEWSLFVPQAFYNSNTLYLSGQNSYLTNDWNRYTFRFNTLGATDITFRCLLSGNASTWLGTSGINIWGAQLEQGSFVTSYIPTSTITVTRNNDLALVNPISGFYNQLEGSVFYEVYRPPVVTLAPNKWGDPLCFFKSDYTNYYVDFYNQIQTTSASVATGFGTTLKITNGGTNPQAEVGTFNNNISYGFYRFSGGYRTNDVVTFGSNAVGTVNTLAYMASTVDVMSIGSFRGLSNFYNGWIRKIAYYPSRLPNTILQYFTK
jgi:hypothetical protein